MHALPGTCHAPHSSGAWIAALAPAPVHNASAGEEDRSVYIKQAAKSLCTIAKLLSTKLEALQRANAITDPRMVVFGHYLLVPGFAGLCGVLTTHPLAAVDSLPYQLYRLHSY